MHIYVAHRSVMWVGLSGAAAFGITWAGVEAGVLHSLLAGPLCGLSSYAGGCESGISWWETGQRLEGNFCIVCFIAGGYHFLLGSLTEP